MRIKKRWALTSSFLVAAGAVLILYSCAPAQTGFPRWVPATQYPMARVFPVYSRLGRKSFPKQMIQSLRDRGVLKTMNARPAARELNSVEKELEAFARKWDFRVGYRNGYIVMSAPTPGWVTMMGNPWVQKKTYHKMMLAPRGYEAMADLGKIIAPHKDLIVLVYDYEHPGKLWGPTPPLSEIRYAEKIAYQLAVPLTQALVDYGKIAPSNVLPIGAHGDPVRTIHIMIAERSPT